MNKFQLFLEKPQTKGAIAIIAAIVMYFTPDHIDRIIELLLAAMGIQQLSLKQKGRDVSN